ncbi:MAG: hypothetical protein PHH00_04155 [Candidatus Nanoarchaeia archaeon]|nr:hypothetical protein [Candidatus Nanoarchaeia archaeon]
MAYTFRNINQQDVPKVRKFFERFNGQFPYSPNFYGHVPMVAGFDNDQLVLAATAYKITEESPCSISHPDAILVSDLLIHPEFRGIGIPKEFIGWLKKVHPERNEIIGNPLTPRVADWAKRAFGAKEDELGRLIINIR